MRLFILSFLFLSLNVLAANETLDRWQENGYHVNAVYKLEAVSVEPGLKRGSGLLGNFDLTLEIDLEKVAGLQGLTFFIYGLGDHGFDPTEYSGDSFATSNIQSPDTFKIYEFYLKYVYVEKWATILGFRDLNADFYSTESAKLFLNSSFGISASLAQTGVNGPSIFPTAAMALTSVLDFPVAYVQAGVFNAVAGNPDNKYGTHLNNRFNQGQLLIAEGGVRPEFANLKSEISLGAWEYSKEIARLDSNGEAKNSGLYAMLDVKWNEWASVFTRWGRANPVVNKFVEATESGVSLKGFIPSRASDSLNFGVATLKASEDQLVANGGGQFETAYELNYQVVISEELKVTPDYQYIWQPGLSASGDRADVYAIRIEMTL